jgi:hypothetical protein
MLVPLRWANQEQASRPLVGPHGPAEHRERERQVDAAATRGPAKRNDSRSSVNHVMSPVVSLMSGLYRRDLQRVCRDSSPLEGVNLPKAPAVDGSFMPVVLTEAECFSLLEQMPFFLRVR